MIVRSVLAVLAGSMLAGASPAADVSGVPGHQGAYVGAFGGVGALGAASMRQVGTVITPDPFPDINVDARGSSDGVVAPVAGLRLGYRFGQSEPTQSGWALGIAVEIEGLYLSARPKGVLDIDPQALGTQYVTLPLGSGALFVNAVFDLHTPHSDTIVPYAGVGAGYAVVVVNGSNSTNPSEPGINHFNSGPDASASALALQARIGLRAKVGGNWSVFTEYRHVHVAPTDFTFGKTDYPDEHLPTTKWNVDLGAQSYNLWVTGIDYHF